MKCQNRFDCHHRGLNPLVAFKWTSHIDEGLVWPCWEGLPLGNFLRPLTAVFRASYASGSGLTEATLHQSLQKLWGSERAELLKAKWLDPHIFVKSTFKFVNMAAKAPLQMAATLVFV
eukprot:1158236-Pelagomonas_calceolata.AAC.8